MAENRAQRRLAAILAADVVGFSRLMEQNEVGTMAALKMRRQDVLVPLVAKHNGRVVKVMGDGVLVEFGSAVDAVQCAIDLHKGFTRANQGALEAELIILRIGINLGDVIVEGSDLYGDGVNIAARLETLAEPGHIVISSTIHDQVKSKFSTGFDDLGIRQLKNIVEPVKVFRVRQQSTPSSEPAKQFPQPADAPAKTSIAVLPFVNRSDDKDQQYLSDGITEDIITELSRFRELKVASRSASFRFRGAEHDTTRIGRELGVHYILEGSLRRMGKRIRITAQLTDATTGQDHWSEKFDRDEEGLFAVQDEIVRVISATLVGRMQKDVIAGLMRRPPNSLAAYEYVQRAAALPLGDAVAEAEARRLLECAIALDPGYALANEGLAISYRAEWALDLSGSDHLIDQALAYAKKAVALDANNDSCQTTLGLILLDHHEYDLGEHHLRKGLSLNPNRPEALAIFAQIYTYCGRPDEALEHFAIAQSIDPFFEPPWFWRTQGVAFFVAGRYEEAIAAMSKSSGMPHWAHGFLAASYAYLDRMEQATYHAAETMRLAPEFSILNAVSKEPFKFDAERQHLVEGMRRAGLPD